MKAIRIVFLFAQLVMLSWIFSLSAAAESPYSTAWIRQTGSASRDDSTCMAMGGSGNVFIGGSSYVDFGGINHGKSDMYLLKYDSSGNLNWSGMLGTASNEYTYAVAADVAGNAYIAGETWGNLGLPLNGPPSDAVVAKYDAGGNLAWTRQIGTLVADTYMAVGANDLGDVFGAGYTFGDLNGINQGAADAFVTKYNAAGDLAWVRQLGGSGHDASNCLIPDKQGGVYMGGQYQTVDGNATSFLARYSSDGALLWTREFAGDSTRALAVTLDNLGNVFVASNYSDPYAPRNAFLTKLDANGNSLWLRHISDTVYGYPMGVSTDAADNIYVAGTVTGDLGGQTSSGGKDAFVMKYDAQGDLLWTKLIGTSVDDFGCGVAVDGQGAVFLAGHTYGDLGGDNAGMSDVFLVKLVPVPEPSPLILLGIVALGLFGWRELGRRMR